MEQDIHFERIGGLGRVLLDRPKALNALTAGQLRRMHPRLDRWGTDASVVAVLIEGAGERAFCAGGDIKAMAESCRQGHLDAAATFFGDEYRLNRRIKTMPKPYVAFLDGITMGGGVGVSVHGRYRVATERTVFAMPETAIGFFPDVGGSFFLPRLAGGLGRYLGLSGARLGPADTLGAGVATHYVESARLPDLRQALAEAADASAIAAVLDGFHQDPGPGTLGDGRRAVIDRCFTLPSVDAVLSALAADGDPFAAETLAVIAPKSPSSVSITFEAIRRGARLDFDACMRMEFRLAMALAPAHDFIEGVRAVLVDKDHKPAWAPPLSEAEVLALFERIPPGGDLTFP